MSCRQQIAVTFTKATGLFNAKADITPKNKMTQEAFVYVKIHIIVFAYVSEVHFGKNQPVSTHRIDHNTAKGKESRLVHGICTYSDTVIHDLHIRACFGSCHPVTGVVFYSTTNQQQEYQCASGFRSIGLLIRRDQIYLRLVEQQIYHNWQEIQKRSGVSLLVFACTI